MTGEAARRELPLWPGLAASALVAVVYLAVASGGTFSFRQSPFPHHVLIADGWLHGQMSVRDEVLADRTEAFYADRRARVERDLGSQGRLLTPEMWASYRARVPARPLLDWVEHEGRRYGYWGPMPAALLLPWVALFGLDVSDMLVSCLLGAGTVLLSYLLLRETTRTGILPVTVAAAAALAVLAGLGTVHFYLAITGQVWFLAQIVAAFFLTLAMVCVLRSDLGSGWVLAAGAALGAAWLSRMTTIATLPFFVGALWTLAPRRDGSHGLARPAIVFAVPLALAVLTVLAFDYARFGDAFETGQGLTVMTGGNPALRADFERYGRLSLHYLARNAYYYLLNPSLRLHPSTHQLTFDPEGNSLFLVTPAFVYLLVAWRRCDVFFLGVWLSVGLSFAGLLLFYATGWYQFGNRYLVDFLPLLVLLVARGMRGRLTPVSAVLIALSLLVNAWGTYRFVLEQF